MVAAVSLLSPVIITVLMPIARSSAKRSLMPRLMMSLSSTTPMTWAPSATTSGVLPSRDTSSTARFTVSGNTPPACSTKARMADAAPLRNRRSPMSTPLMRVLALKATACAPCRARGLTLKLRRASATMERPSGVSSANDARQAASATAASGWPGAAMNRTASRLPSVIVPVLSSSSTSTSPAASIARPEVARTLAFIIRLMPAMPTAESSAPMVVGIRHTSSAINTVMLTVCPAPLS